MITCRSVLDELVRFDELNRQRFCADCADVPEARCSRWRLAFERAGAAGNGDFMVCGNCAARWAPGPDIDDAVRGWMIVLSEGFLAAVLCGPCMAANPEPAVSLPKVARLLLSRSRGPVQ